MSAKGHILVIDDEAGVRSVIEDFLVAEGHRVTTFESAPQALHALRSGGELGDPSQEPDLIISDLKMAHMDGMEFLRVLHKERPAIPVVLATAFGTIDTAIEAMRSGAYDYLVKPFKLAEIGVIVRRALEKRKLSRENEILRAEVKRQWGVGNVLGKSPAMKRVFDLVNRVSPSTSNVLITGESGTGKEVIARLIHSSGPRASQPFVAINCTAIPETLLESELFGHAKGSFTGASQRKRGLFEEANGGTLFLDEIGDMSPVLQAKLLRVIQERKIRPVGDNALTPVDVRIIAATHKDLKAAIKDGAFREDLFYRLSVIPIAVPPLRERVEDIPLLAEHFLRRFAAANGSAVKGFSKDAVSKLVKLRWEGNVRELENRIERAVVLSQGHLIDESDILDANVPNAEDFFRQATSDFPSASQLEERYIKLILEKTGGRKDKAAQILGMSRRTLYRKEREYGLVPEEEPLLEPSSNSKSESESYFVESPAYESQ